MASNYVFKLQDGRGLTSVVVSEEEFEDLIVTLRNMEVMNVQQQSRVDDAQMQRLRETQVIPLILRGARTMPVFQKFGVNTELMSVIVRGAGPAVFEAMFGVKN